MSLAQILEALPAFSVAERQMLVHRAIQLDEPALSPDDENIVATRLENHRLNPASALSFEEMKTLIHTRLG